MPQLTEYLSEALNLPHKAVIAKTLYLATQNTAWIWKYVIMYYGMCDN